MKTTFKAVLAAGAVAAFLAASAGKVNAEPVVSSWYGSELEGSPTANGEPYRPDARTAAHRSLPFGTELLVTYGRQQTVVRVTDRGPFVGGRDLDLSRAAAEEIGLTVAGADAVDVRVLADSTDYEARPSHMGYEVRSPSKSPRSSNRERDGVATFLRERPYLQVLGAPYSGSSAGACQGASMKAPTPNTEMRLPSIESTKTRVVAAAARCSPRMLGL